MVILSLSFPALMKRDMGPCREMSPCLASVFAIVLPVFYEVV